MDAKKHLKLSRLCKKMTRFADEESLKVFFKIRHILINDFREQPEYEKYGEIY